MGNGTSVSFITWPQFMALAAGIVITPITVAWILIGAHTGQTHAGSVTVREWDIMRARITDLEHSIEGVGQTLTQVQIYLQDARVREKREHQ